MEPTIRHRIEVQHRAHVDSGDGTLDDGAPAPANLYRSANYVVVDIGLPGCQPQHIQVTLAPDALLVVAERHAGTEATQEAREYVLHELPDRTVRRSFQIPSTDLALHEAEAHFADGMLTVNIPTVGRDAYRHEVRGETRR